MRQWMNPHFQILVINKRAQVIRITPDRFQMLSHPLSPVSTHHLKLCVQTI